MLVWRSRDCSSEHGDEPEARIASMTKTLDERIQAYADYKGTTWKEAHDYLIDFALNTIDGRRKGGTKVGNRPQQGKHLAKARRSRAK